MSADLAMAPVSRPLAKLLHQVHAQIIREAVERSEPGEPVRDLGPLERPSVRYSCDHIVLEASNGETRFIRRRECPASWRSSCVAWHPSFWYAYEERVDSAGLQWNRTGGIFVCDDFGNLVEVAS